MHRPVNPDLTRHFTATTITRVHVVCPHCSREQELACIGLPDDVMVRCTGCRMVMAKWGVIVEVAARARGAPAGTVSANRPSLEDTSLMPVAKAPIASNEDVKPSPDTPSTLPF